MKFVFKVGGFNDDTKRFYIEQDGSVLRINAISKRKFSNHAFTRNDGLDKFTNLPDFIYKIAINESFEEGFTHVVLLEKGKISFSRIWKP